MAEEKPVDKATDISLELLKHFRDVEYLRTGERIDDEELVARLKTNAPPPISATQLLIQEYRMSVGKDGAPISFYRMAKNLDVSGQRLHQWKEGKVTMPDKIAGRICMQIYAPATDKERDLSNKRWLLLLAAERADREQDVHSGSLWRSMAKQLAVLLCPLVLWLPTDLEARMLSYDAFSEPRTLTIMLNRIRRWWLRGRWRSRLTRLASVIRVTLSAPALQHRPRPTF